MANIVNRHGVDYGNGEYSAHYIFNRSYWLFLVAISLPLPNKIILATK